MRTIAISAIAAIAVVVGLVAGDRRPQASKSEKENIVKGNTAFALDLYSRLRSQEGNLFFSPYSISTALAMTYAGAHGETAEQMAKVLHFSGTRENVASAFAALDQELTAGEKAPNTNSTRRTPYGLRRATPFFRRIFS